jgi:hypothetical protein
MRSRAVWPVDSALQVDGGDNEEGASGGSILDEDDDTDDLYADQPEDHCRDRLLVSLTLV